MSRDVYRYRFQEEVPLEEVRDSFILAAVAAEGVHGRARVLLDTGYAMDERARVCVVDATTPVGKTVTSIFTNLLAREFGDGAFTVERVGDAPAPRSASEAGIAR